MESKNSLIIKFTTLFLILRHINGLNDTDAEFTMQTEVATTELLTPPPTASQPILDLKSEMTTRRSEKKEVNRKPKTTTTERPEESSEAVLYRLNSEGGSGGTCILFLVDALVSFTYTTKLNIRQESDLLIPESASISGDCSNEDDAILILKWRTFVLGLSFSKTPGGERWFVEKVELTYDPSDRKTFEHIKYSGGPMTLSTPHSHSSLLFPTPVGKAYTCHREVEIKLTSEQTDTIAILYLRKLKIEPFIFKNNEFGPEYKCAKLGAGSFRSETAPLIVGSTLAAACLLTVTGYSIFRYFKIKKVQYDTME